jgi:hypothetical protein
VKELCEGLSLNSSLKTPASLSRGFDLLHTRIEQVCVLEPRAIERNLATSRRSGCNLYFQSISYCGCKFSEWFTKSFVNNIGKDIAMGGVVMEEKAISHAQYLDLVYSQTGTLYDLLPDLPRPNTSSTSTTPAASHAADGVIGSTQAQPHFASSTNPKSTSSNVQNASSPSPPTSKTSEVNAVQSTPAGKNKSKKGRGKNKEGKNNSPAKQTKTTPIDDWDKRKPRYPCLICGDDHYTKDCPRCVEVTKFLQGAPKPLAPAVLSQPFPSQKQAQLVTHDQPSSSNTSYVLMCTGDSKQNNVALTTQAKDYSPSKEKVDDLPPSLVQPSPTTPPTNGPLHLERLSLDTVL